MGQTYTVQFSPALPIAGESIIATVTSTSGPSCLPIATAVTQSGPEIILRLDYEDICQGGTPVASKDYNIGAYPGGSYTFEIDACADNPPPLPSPCNIAFQGTLVVGAPFNATVPTDSLSSGIVMFVGLVLIGLIGLRIRRLDAHRMAA